MSERLIDLGNGFLNIRGNHRLGGVFNVGTQCSLVRLNTGRTVILDSYGLSGRIKIQVMEMTDGGKDVEAILNLHPYHTLHCATMHRLFPDALLYGFSRHHREWPDLPWQPDVVSSTAVTARFTELQFSLPDGIDSTSCDQRAHAGSLLAYHSASGSLHVDDTLNVLPIPTVVRRLLGMPQLAFHPTVPRALMPRPGAADEFRKWATRIAGEWSTAQTICAAHSAILPIQQGSLPDHIQRGLDAIEPALRRAEVRRR